MEYSRYENIEIFIKTQGNPEINEMINLSGLLKEFRRDLI